MRKSGVSGKTSRIRSAAARAPVVKAVHALTLRNPVRLASRLQPAALDEDAVKRRQQRYAEHRDEPVDDKTVDQADQPVVFPSIMPGISINSLAPMTISANCSSAEESPDVASQLSRIFMGLPKADAGSTRPTRKKI